MNLKQSLFIVMKTVVYVLLFLAMPLCSLAQKPTVEHVQLTKHNSQTNQHLNPQKNKVLSVENKSQVLYLNYKKSMDLISIKAFRKSLQIKTKAVKIC